MNEFEINNWLSAEIWHLYRFFEAHAKNGGASFDQLYCWDIARLLMSIHDNVRLLESRAINAEAKLNQADQGNKIIPFPVKQTRGVEGGTPDREDERVPANSNDNDDIIA